MSTKKKELQSITGSSHPMLERHVPNDGQHQVTLNPTQYKKGIQSEKPDISSEFHFTVGIRNKSLTRKHWRLMLEVCLFETLESGINLFQYMTIEHLMSLLLGQKTDPLDLRNEHERRLTSLSMSILRSVREFEFSPGEKQKIQLSSELKKYISETELLMNRRTYMSRQAFWKPEKWILISAVAVETLFERSGNSERYSSYCKGYGESHKSLHYKKTLPSAELDGEEPNPREIRLSEYQDLFNLNQLDLKLKMFQKKT